MKKKKPKQEKLPYEAIIRIFGKVYKAEGNSPLEAISNLKVTGKAGGSSVLSVIHGKERRDRILNTNQVFRLFSASRLMREVALKNLSILFDNL